MERQIFYHHLRIIFTYYASQGNKQGPLVLRQKQFQKFIVQSTIGQQFKSQQKSKNSSPSKTLRIKTSNNTSVKILTSPFTKPIKFQEFVKILTTIISKNMSNKNSNGLQEIEEQENIQDLFELCKQYQVLVNIFQFLYEQIEHNTQFGRLVLFSKEKEHFNKECFKEIMKNLKILRIIYSHYFQKSEKHQSNGLQRILSFLKTVFHQFEIVPQKLSLTDIFILLVQVVESVSRSVYQRQCQRILSKHEQIEQNQWPSFSFLKFLKVIIMATNLLALKNIKNQQFQFIGQNIINFLQMVAISKGYKTIKTTYKINQSIFKTSKESQKHQSQLIKEKQAQNNLLFKVKRLEQSNSTLLLTKISKLISLIFDAYTSNKNIYSNTMSKQSFQFFFKQFKLIPNIISKLETEKIYMRIFLQRQFYQQQNNQTLIINNQLIEDKQRLVELIQNPQFGLRYEQFQKVLIYTSQSQNICTSFTSYQRLLYCFQHIFSQQKFKQLLQREINQNRLCVSKIDGSNPKFLIKKYLDSQQILQNFQKNHKSMYAKLKRTQK